MDFSEKTYFIKCKRYYLTINPINISIFYKIKSTLFFFNKVLHLHLQFTVLNIFVKVIGLFENNHQPKWWITISILIKCYCGSLLTKKCLKKRLQKNSHNSKKVKNIITKLIDYDNQLLKEYQTKLTKLKTQLTNTHQQKKKDNYQLSISALEQKIQNLQEEMEQIYDNKNNKIF